MGAADDILTFSRIRVTTACELINGEFYWCQRSKVQTAD